MITFSFLMEGEIETTDEIVSRFAKLSFKNKIMFTNYRLEYTYYRDIYRDEYT